MIDNSLKVKKSNIYALFLSLFVFIFSLYVFDYYINGDQKEYHNFYDNCLSNIFSYIENYECYNNMLGSSEPIYFILASIFSIFVSKNVFISFFNALLTFIFVKLINIKKENYLLTFFLIFNFYFLVILFSAERLKFSLFFLFWAIYFFLKNNTLDRKILIFTVLACLSHFQVLILIGGFLLAYYRNKLTLTNMLFLSTSVLIYIYLFYDLILYKFNSYLNIDNLLDSFLSFVKVGIFIIISFIYIKDLKLKNDIFLVSIPLLIAAFLLGSDRLVIFGFFIYLFVYIFKQKNINFDIFIFIIVGYYFFKSWGFLNNILEYGNGF